MPDIKYPDEEVEVPYDKPIMTDEQRAENQAKAKSLQEKISSEVKPFTFNLRDARIHFDVFIGQVDSMFAAAKDMVVNNDKTNVDATELGTSAMALYKKIIATKSKVRYYEDAKTYVDAVDSLASMLSEKLYSTSKKHETIVSITKDKISAYAAVLEGERLRQEEMERKAREKLGKELKEEFGDKAPTVDGPLISSKRDQTVRTETGTAYAVHTWEFEIQERDLPLKLLTELLVLIFQTAVPKSKVHEVAERLKSLMSFISVMYEDSRLRKGVKDGIRNIEGIKIFEKIGTRFKT